LNTGTENTWEAQRLHTRKMSRLTYYTSQTVAG
jgi:hypothetical protein